MTQSNINFLNKTIGGKIYDHDSLIVSYKIQYPQFLSFSFSEQFSTINAYYKERSNQFQLYNETAVYHRAVSHYSNSIANKYPIITYQGILTYTPTYNKNCTISLYFDEYVYEGGNHGRTKRTSNTWNLDQGVEYALNSFFPKDFPYKKYITDNIIDQIDKKVEEGSTDFFDDYKTLVEERFHSDNFYLVDSGIIIYYQEYEIGPYSSGILKFEIPYVQDIVYEPKCY